MTAESAVLSGLERLRSWQEKLYRDLYQHPELSHQEHRTAEKVADRLGAAGYVVHEGFGGTEVVGVRRNGDGPTVLLRADMDALPVQEATGLPYAGRATANDREGNEVPVVHACGHDMHVTCLLGAAQRRRRLRELFGDRAHPMARQTARGDFGEIPIGLGVPYTYWGLGCIDRGTYEKAAAAGRVVQDVPGNHSPSFAPVIQPTCDAGPRRWSPSWPGSGPDVSRRGHHP